MSEVDFFENVTLAPGLNGQTGYRDLLFYPCRGVTVAVVSTLAYSLTKCK